MYVVVAANLTPCSARRQAVVEVVNKQVDSRVGYICVSFCRCRWGVLVDEALIISKEKWYHFVVNIFKNKLTGIACQLSIAFRFHLPVLFSLICRFARSCCFCDTAFVCQCISRLVYDVLGMYCCCRGSCISKCRFLLFCSTLSSFCILINQTFLIN